MLFCGKTFQGILKLQPAEHFTLHRLPLRDLGTTWELLVSSPARIVWWPGGKCRNQNGGWLTVSIFNLTRWRLLAHSTLNYAKKQDT